MTLLKSFCVSAAIVVSGSVTAQPVPKLEWEHCYGGSSFEDVEVYDHLDDCFSDHKLVRTRDGGYAFVAVTVSNDGDVSGNHSAGLNSPSEDFWLVKTDLSGKIQWQKCFGGSQSDAPTCLIQTSDGGFALCGWTLSHDGDVTDPYPETISPNPITGAKFPKFEGWVVKTDSMGVKEWARNIGSQTGLEVFNSVIEVSDGFLAVGTSSLAREEGWMGHAYTDALVVKLDSKGGQQWHRLIGGNYGDQANSVISVPGGGYVFAGWSQSTDGDLTGLQQHGSEDAWVVRLDTDGLIMWQKCYGGSSSDRANCVFNTGDGYVVAGWTSSNDGDVIGQHGYQDGWILRIDTNGTLLKQICLGGSDSDIIHSVIRTADGNFVFAGNTISTDGDVSGLHHGSVDSADGWVGELSPDLTLLWQNCLGGTGSDGFSTVIETADHGLLLNGSTETANNGDVSGNHPGKGSSGEPNRVSDVWNVKLRNPAAKVEGEIALAARHDLYPNPAQTEVYLDIEGASPLRKIQFYSSLGVEVFPEYHTQGARAVITVTDLPAGVYAVIVRYDGAPPQVRRFIHAGK
ncbi:MAG: T9SS type A sorting domain-containing protein [Bacteroidota bacterium]|nr:T9SS type A sorting domain-containing protein [Bacteroidota bacterium]MDP4234012.1 T9SS type A sorting domain-containing protein [Bacteroidota bacterium]MDP4242878.1 T9SS type A sorting domain-containing protein [Bacteroidota bacterium]MDP4287683.1 T9SS type A sorting domain-containing protein [Bacteroidota bacterium]